MPKGRGYSKGRKGKSMKRSGGTTGRKTVRSVGKSPKKYYQGGGKF